MDNWEPAYREPTDVEQIIKTWLIEQKIFPRSLDFLLPSFTVLHNQKRYLFLVEHTKLVWIGYPNKKDKVVGDIADPDFFEKLGEILCLSGDTKK
jgi:hypothetical protein